MAKEDKDNPRRILEVNVEEVSLVDRAANLRKFLVIKRVEEDTMGAFEAEVVKVDDGIFNEFYETIAEVEKALPADNDSDLWLGETLDVIKALPEDLAKAVKEVSTWMKRMAAMKGSPGPAIKRVLTFLGKVMGGGFPAPKPVDKEDDIPTEEEAKKALGEDLSKALTQIEAFMTKAADNKFPHPKTVDGDKVEIEKALPSDLSTSVKLIATFLQKAVAGQYPYPKPVAKAVEPKPAATQKNEGGSVESQAVETPAVQIMDDGRVIVAGKPVSKGKGFTPSRTGALKDVAMQLLKLLGDVGDEETMKALAEAVKGLPASGPDSTVDNKKSEEDKAEKAELVKTIADLKKRLDDIERTRPAATSTEDGTATQEVKKSFWDGVI